MANADSLRDAQPWHPITDPLELKILGKLAEELNECGAAVARCMIQGVNEREPVTKKLNQQWLQDEIADVLAGARLTIDHYGLDPNEIDTRMKKKIAHLKQWHCLP